MPSIQSLSHVRLPIQVQAILFRKINRETQYLLLKRISSTAAFWQPVTGGIEEGETEIQAPKKRNTRRNRNQKPRQNHEGHPLLRVLDLFKRENRQRLIKEYAFGVEVSPNEKITISWEHTEYKWCSFKEALKLLKYKGNKEALEKLSKILSEQKQTYHAR